MAARDAVLTVIGEQRKGLETELAALDKAAKALGVEPVPTSTGEQSAPSPRRKPKGRRRQKSSPSHADADARRERLYKWLAEQGEPRSGSEAWTALDFSKNEFRTAIDRLLEEGWVNKTGERQFTRYTVAAGPPPVPSRPDSEADGTPAGRLLAIISARGFATALELAADTGMPEGEVKTLCGQMIREEEVHMEQRAGRPGYVLAGA